MAYTSEIEKLERRNAENPQGRLFAPLADAYRKQGELDRAMSLLREGLERHPDYIGAQIVLGRCHLDLGQDTEATAAFEHVLGLDGENVIALRALAEIAERGERWPEAEARLQRLLEIDRGNEEAAAQLERLRARPAAPAAEPAPAGAEAEAAPADEPMAPPAGIELTSGFVSAAVSPADAPPPLPELEVVEPPEVEEAVERVAGLEEVEPVDIEPVAGLEPEEPPAIAPVELEGEDFHLEREADILLEGSAENEFQSRSDAERLAAREADADTPNPWQNLAAETVPAPVEPPSPPAWSGAEAVAAEPPALEEFEAPEPEPPAEEPADVGEPELVITETMAAVYERQGLREAALRVYRELAARRPEDARLAAKVAELEAEAPARPEPAPEPTPAAGLPARRAAEYAAAETGGESLGAFLRGVLSARLAGPGREEAPAPRAGLEEAGLDAAPTRPAADPISLSAVFGDELPPAAPAASQPVPASGQGFSFDTFFGGGAPSAREGARPAPSGDDDLEQFHAWLQGLKK